LAKTLAAMLDIFGDRPAFIGRELTKKFEQTYRGRLSELSSYFGANRVKGEIVIVVAGNDAIDSPKGNRDD
jgi:16S rRNA (cytidine1402-2'-O)-methyltransferase